MAKEQKTRRITVEKDAAVLVFSKDDVTIELPESVDFNTIQEDSYIVLAGAIFAILYYKSTTIEKIRKEGLTLINIAVFLNECKQVYFECERKRKEKRKGEKQ